MKICYIASTDITIKFILLNQLKFLKKEGYDVHVICSPGRWVKEIENEGIKVGIIKLTRKISPVADIIAFTKIFLYIKGNKFNIVHTHTPKAGLIGQLAAKVAGVPIIVNTVHGFYFQETDSWLKRNFFILTEKVAATCSDLIFFVNEEDMKTAIAEKICSANAIRYVGGGIDTKKFNPTRFSQDFILKKKEELGISSQSTVVGIVARFVEEKGYLELFQAFRKVISNFPKAIILAVGFPEPEKKDAINITVTKKYGIEKNVIFLEERTDVDEMYALIDVFVLPSHREGLGISIIEASAMQKPIVATNIRGCRESVEDQVTGLLIPPKCPDKLAEAVIFLLQNPTKAKEMGMLARQRVLERFDESIVFERIKKEYERLIQENLLTHT